MNKATRNFLKCCRKVGIRRVAIGCKDKKIKASISFSSGVYGSAFANESYDGWPAIWRAAKLAGIFGGCGNHNQCQIETDGIDCGIYVCDGRWRKESDGIG